MREVAIIGALLGCVGCRVGGDGRAVLPALPPPLDGGPVSSEADPVTGDHDGASTPSAAVAAA